MVASSSWAGPKQIYPLIGIELEVVAPGSVLAHPVECHHLAESVRCAGEGLKVPLFQRQWLPLEKGGEHIQHRGQPGLASGFGARHERIDEPCRGRFDTACLAKVDPGEEGHRAVAHLIAAGAE
jgi:hypothetical protein